MADPNISPSIMVVDDDAGIREALTDILEDEGYVVTSAPDGLAALEMLREQQMRPRLVLLDLMMPRMNGWQFRAEQRQDPDLAAIPVVVISASGNAREQSQVLGAAEYLPKPIEFDQLVGIVERYCGTFN
jgi:CheY-like chemotaxis protein